MAWILGTVLVGLWSLQAVTMVEYDRQYRAVTGYVADGPEVVGGALLVLLVLGLTPVLAS